MINSALKPGTRVIDANGQDWSWAAVGQGLRESGQGLVGAAYGIGQGFYSLGAGAYNTAAHPVATYKGTVDLVANGILAGQDLYQGFSTNPRGTFNEITSGLVLEVNEQSRKSTFEQTRSAAKLTTEIGAPIAAGVIIKGLLGYNSPNLNFTKKIFKQMEQRGWTQAQIEEAIQSGQQVSAVNKANGDPATRYISPTTGRSVVVDNKTGEVIHVGGSGFKYGSSSGDIKK